MAFFYTQCAWGLILPWPFYFTWKYIFFPFYSKKNKRVCLWCSRLDAHKGRELPWRPVVAVNVRVWGKYNRVCIHGRNGPKHWHSTASDRGGGWNADRWWGTWIRKDSCLSNNHSFFFFPPPQKRLPMLDHLSRASGSSIPDLTIFKMHANQRQTMLFISTVNTKYGQGGQLGQQDAFGPAVSLMTPMEASEEHGFLLVLRSLCTAATLQCHPCREAKRHRPISGY